MDIEQERRDFKQANPSLYAYIVAVELAKALDSAGDTVSGSLDGHHAANRIWARAGHYRDQALVMRQDPKTLVDTGNDSPGRGGQRDSQDVG